MAWIVRYRAERAWVSGPDGIGNETAEIGGIHVGRDAIGKNGQQVTTLASGRGLSGGHKQS